MIKVTAMGYVSTGHEKGDINSTAFLHDIVTNHSSKFADMELAKDLLMVKTSKNYLLKFRFKIVFC